MAIRNLTPHAITVFSESQFTNLEKVNPTTFLADGVDGEPVRIIESEGMLRIATSTVEAESVDGLMVVTTEYGDLTGVPNDLSDDDWLIVSLPAQSMAKQSGHPLAERMLAPYKVVRSRKNGSVVLGCMGFTL